jgi:hypothetical protein
MCSSSVYRAFLRTPACYKKCMSMDTFASLKQLSDAELIARVKELVARERGATALLIAHLAELDTRDVLLREGYASLFAYCREALGLSDHETFNRIEAARAARRFPVIVEMLAAGAVHLTAVRLLAPHLTAHNHRRVLEEARGKRTEQIREMVAALAPKPDAPPTIRKVSTPSPAAAPPSVVQAGEAGGQDALSAASSSPDPTPASVTQPSAATATLLPLAPDRYKPQVTIDGGTLEKLRLAKEMLRHAVPAGDEAEILDRALTTLLTDLARKKFAATDRPRGSQKAAPGSRNIPAEIQRAVWVRDLGRCAFVGASGHRCTERGFVEFHHVRPYEVGGAATIGNIQLRCGRHNRYEARVYFNREDARGEGFVSEAGPSYGTWAQPVHGNSF